MPDTAHGPGASTRPAQSLAYIRQLCCLGLPPETLIVELLQTLEWVIPSQSNTFIQIGKTGPMALIAGEVVPEAIETFATQWSTLVSPEVMDLNLRALLDQTVLRDLMEFWPGFADLEMYRLVWQPMDIHHTMQALVRHEGRPTGLLNLSRPRGFTTFRDADRITLLRLLPYVEHGLSARADPGPRSHRHRGDRAFHPESARGTGLQQWASPPSVAARSLPEHSSGPIHPGARAPAARSCEATATGPGGDIP